MENDQARLLARSAPNLERFGVFAGLRASLGRLFGGRTAPEPYESGLRGPSVRAAIYGRDVFDGEGELVRSAAEQADACRAFAAQRGYTIVGSFLDTSTDPEQSRPQLQRLRAAIWRHNVDVVISTNPEQLYIDVNRLVRFAREAYALNVSVEFTDGSPAEDLLYDE
jgi:hypothetical protein